jgi:hypothetical protein
MRIFWKAQRSANSLPQSIATDGNKLEKMESGFMTPFENNAREILLFLTSLIFLLFNLFEERTGPQPR